MAHFSHDPTEFWAENGRFAGPAGSQMRILHVTESRGWSGGTVQLWRLTEALVKKGHQAALFCPPNSELLTHTEGSGVRVATSPIRQDYDLTAARRLAELIRDFQPDVVHAHHPKAHALSLLAGFFCPFKNLIVSRRVSFKLNKWNIFSQWKYRTPRIKMFVAVSEDIGRVLAEGGVPEEKISVIHSGVDVSGFSPRPKDEALRGELGLPEGKPVVASVTHWSWWKGQTFFLEAARQVLDRGISAHFLLAGKDTDGPQAREKVKALGLENHVTLAGFRRDMPAVLSLVNVSVLSSLAGEGFSGVLRESMAMGVPVVATDVGGNRELVEPDKTGLLVAAGDAKTLAEAIGRQLSDPARALAMAAAAQDNVRRHYSLEAMAQKTISLYEKIAS